MTDKISPIIFYFPHTQGETMKSTYFNSAKIGKPAIALIVNGDVTFDTEEVVNMVEGRPLYIRWAAKNPIRSVEVHYGKVALHFGTPHSVISVNGTFPMKELADSLMTLDHQITTCPDIYTPPAIKKVRKPHVVNPVKKSILSGTAADFLDAELEQLLALLIECI